jgi:hypothetical protein
MFLVEQAHWYYEVRLAGQHKAGTGCTHNSSTPDCVVRRVCVCTVQDYVRDQDTSLRSLGLKEFAAMVFQNCPELAEHAVRVVSLNSSTSSAS